MATVRYKANEVTQPSQADLNRLNAIKDEDIDFSDIPKLTDDFFTNAEVGKFYRPQKKQVTIKIDVDILDWLNTDDKDYQTRLNSILRKSMLETVAVS